MASNPLQILTNIELFPGPGMYSCHIKYVILFHNSIVKAGNSRSVMLTKSRKGGLVSLCCSYTGKTLSTLTKVSLSPILVSINHNTSLSPSSAAGQLTPTPPISSPQGGARLRGSYRTSTPRLRLPASAEISSGHFLV